jgi:hypothetical protein
MAQLYQLPNGAVYLYLFNEYWPVVDMATLNGVFGANPATNAVNSLPCTGGNPPIGPSISDGSFLFRNPGDQTIYFMCTGNYTAYPIGSMAAMRYYQFYGTIFPADNSDAVVAAWLQNTMTVGDMINS